MPQLRPHSTGCVGAHSSVAHATQFFRAPSVNPASRKCRNQCICRAEASEATQPDASTPAPTQSGAAAASPPAGATPEQPKKPSAHAACSEALENIPVTIIGDDTELNWAVCQALSKKIGWFPVCNQKVLLGLHKAEDAKQLEEKLGAEGIAAEELKVLKGMSSQFRCCVATIGNGASSIEQAYQHIYGHLIIWIDETNRRKPKQPTPTRLLHYNESEVRAKLDIPTGFSSKPLTTEDKAKQATSQIIKAINQLLKEHSYLPAKKRLYIDYGCRGDWPELKPKEWSPVLDLLDRKPVQVAEQ